MDEEGLLNAACEALVRVTSSPLSSGSPNLKLVLIGVVEEGGTGGLLGDENNPSGVMLFLLSDPAIFSSDCDLFLRCPL